VAFYLYLVGPSGDVKINAKKFMLRISPIGHDEMKGILFPVDISQQI
jgi:hypothetical protein